MALCYTDAMKKHIGLALVALLAGAAFAEVHTYTSAQTVSTVISGEDSVVVNCGSGNFVTFTGANTFTGGVTIQSGGVVVSSLTALGASGPISCANGTAIRVCVGYNGTATTLNAAVIDRIQVQGVASGEPYVSIQVTGEGVKNSVDFSAQPYLWLGSPNSTTSETLDGTFTPCGDVYRFGYAGGMTGEARNLIVKGLCDNPTTGAPRSVLVRGSGNATFADAASSFTGGVVVEGPSCISIGDGANFGTGYKSIPDGFVTLRNGGRINLKNSNKNFPFSIRCEGTNTIHSCGASATVCTILSGAITGWGEFRLTDQGGVRFTSPSNTFTGVLRMATTHSVYDIEIGFGDGANCSWAGSEIVQYGQANNIVVVNCDDDFTLNTTIGSAGGRLVKRGKGVLTLPWAFPRKRIRSGLPVMIIEGGAVKRTAKETTAPDGLLLLKNGGTLDLNGVAADSVWLPVGTGSIVNPADGAMVVRGTPMDGEYVFTGTLGGATTCKTSGGMPWKLTCGTEVNGKLTVDLGTVRLQNGVQLAELDVHNAGHVLFDSDTAGDIVGLKTDIWFKGSTWAGSTSAEKMVDGLNYAATHEPTVSTDMSAFNGLLKSGENNSTDGVKGPFKDILGGTKDYFVARWTGYFIAETDGAYTFRVYADDCGRVKIGETVVVNCSAGSAGTGYDGTITLTKGSHPIEIWFVEFTGWEVFRVEVKKPGESSFATVPTSLLSTWNGESTTVGAVGGTGTLSLVDNATWPSVLGLDAFTGCLLANASTATPAAGKVTSASSVISFVGDGALGSDFWTLKEKALFCQSNGRVACLLNQGITSTYGAINTARALDVGQPFTVDFDFSAVPPFAGSVGDGFALVLHDGKTGSHGGTFSYGDSNKLGDASAYGIQLYLMPYENRIAWVKNKTVMPPALTNVQTSAFTMLALEYSPMHCRMTWDLTNLVFTMTHGAATWCSTNSAAKTDLPAQFAEGAYLGIWGQDGGYFCGKLVENLTLRSSIAFDGAAPIFDGVLGLTNGVTSVTAPGADGATLASDLDVSGAATLAAQDPVALTGDVWTFALTNSAAALTVTGPFDCSGLSSVTVEAVGEVPLRRRVLADLSGVTGGSPALAFAKGASLPPSCRLSYENGVLAVSNVKGAVIYVR